MTGYLAEAIFSDAQLVDVRVIENGRTRHLGGKKGPVHELARVADLPVTGVLPVFLGSGLGLGIKEYLSQSIGPVAIVDREERILELTGLQDELAADPRIFWVQATDTNQILNVLTQWQMTHDGLPFRPVLDPFYARLRPELYRTLNERLVASQEFDFWAQAKYPKFQETSPRILLLTSTYFLMGEIQAACDRLGYATCFVQLPSQEVGSQEFVETILSEVLRFKPDFILTINHLGVDKEGVLTDLLARLELPLASWFVDNPHLILYFYQNLTSDWMAIFTWDADNLESLRAQGFKQVIYLPLATDAHRFVPRSTSMTRELAFVGNSMVYKVRDKLEQYAFPALLVQDLALLGQGFMNSGLFSVSEFLQQEYPQHFSLFAKIPDIGVRLGYEALITWQATLVYRLERVRALLSFAPMIVGDTGWFELLPQNGWAYHGELNYYTDLPIFYPATRINFNCTSQQMKGAVNQRVFDVPAGGGFLLTDYRRQMEHLFDLGQEMIVYNQVEEIPDLVRYYLAHNQEREKIIQAGRKRVLAEHTYDQRLATLVQSMRTLYS